MRIGSAWAPADSWARCRAPPARALGRLLAPLVGLSTGQPHARDRGLALDRPGERVLAVIPLYFPVPLTRRPSSSQARWVVSGTASWASAQLLPRRLLPRHADITILSVAMACPRRPRWSDRGLLPGSGVPGGRGAPAGVLGCGWLGGGFSGPFFRFAGSCGRRDSRLWAGVCSPARPGRWRAASVRRRAPSVRLGR